MFLDLNSKKLYTDNGQLIKQMYCPKTPNWKEFNTIENKGHSPKDKIPIRRVWSYGDDTFLDVAWNVLVNLPSGQPKNKSYDNLHVQR